MRRLAAAGAVVLVLVAGVGAWRWHAARSAPPVREARAEPRVTIPDGARIRVEVRNDSRVTGLARRATFYLRDQGFDVVDYYGAAGAARDSTLVIDRSGHPEWARLVARALGGATVITERDSSRYLDVTVLLGRSWTPPAQPFYP
jgi:hypothetical protein